MMETRHFDQLTSTFVQTPSRRGMLRLLGAALLGAGSLGVLAAQPSAAKVHRKHHAKYGKSKVTAARRKRPVPPPGDGTGGGTGDGTGGGTGPTIPANMCPAAFTCPDPFGGPAPVCGTVAGPGGGTCGCFLSTEGNTICVNETDSDGEFLDADTLQPCASTQECRETVGFHFFCKAVTKSPSGKTCGSTVSRCWPECDNRS